MHDVRVVVGAETDAALRGVGRVPGAARVVDRDDPSQWFGYTVACCARVFRLNPLKAYFRAFRTTPSSWPSAHVSQPFTANQLPPTYTAWLSPTPMSWPRLVSWTPRWSAAGDLPGANPRWPAGGADARQEAPDVLDELPGLRGGRRSGEDRPRLRLAEDDPAAELRWGPVALAFHRVTLWLRVLESRPRPSDGAGWRTRHPQEAGELGETRIDVGRLGNHKIRVGHLQEGGRGVGPVPRAPAQILAMRAAQGLLVVDRLLEVLPRVAEPPSTRDLVVEEPGVACGRLYSAGVTSGQ